QFLRRNPRSTRVDQCVVLLHYALWLVPPVLLLGAADALLNYALITVLIGFYTGMIFVVNHVGTRVIEPDESISFFQQEISVTRNLGASRLHDFVFGGVNNHIEHHLFPSMPTARLRSARRRRRSRADPRRRSVQPQADREPARRKPRAQRAAARSLARLYPVRIRVRAAGGGGSRSPRPGRVPAPGRSRAAHVPAGARLRLARACLEPARFRAPAAPRAAARG